MLAGVFHIDRVDKYLAAVDILHVDIIGQVIDDRPKKVQVALELFVCFIHLFDKRTAFLVKFFRMRKTLLQL